MIGFQYFSGALADNDAGSHGVACRHARHNRGVGNTQVFDSVDLEIAVYVSLLFKKNFEGEEDEGIEWLITLFRLVAA